MGRIKTLQIKRITRELMKLHSDKFTEDYKGNKEVVKNLISTQSNKLRNIITGYVTRLVRQSKEPKKSYTGLSEDIEKFYK